MTEETKPKATRKRKAKAPKVEKKAECTECDQTDKPEASTQRPLKIHHH